MIKPATGLPPGVDQLEPCPLCQLYDFVEVEDFYTIPDGSVVSASIGCDDCTIYVHDESIVKAVVSWNRLSVAMQKAGGER